MSAQDVGNPDQPGEYRVNDRFFQVDRLHLDIWRERPATVFRTVLRTKVGDDRVRLALGAPFLG